ncbi:ATP-dependent helicase [bacterium]|nr:ATP-dependent helicase [bacterium]
MPELTREQLAAVESDSRYLKIVAAAGSGKTRTLTARVAKYINDGVAAQSVLAITFTRRAALELRDRIVAQCGAKDGNLVRLGTIHGFCAELLRRFGHLIGYPAFTIYDDYDREYLLTRSILRYCKKTIKSKSALRKALKIAQECLAWMSQPVDPGLRAAIDDYQDTLRRNRAVDYDGLEVLTLQLIGNHAPVQQWIAGFKAVLLDEGQDTSKRQWRLIMYFGENSDLRGLTVVGDDCQSIYGWRDADVDQFLRFGDSAPDDTDVTALETNFRSVPEIIRRSSELIAYNKYQIRKTVRAHREQPVHFRPSTSCRRYPDYETEASDVFRRIEQDFIDKDQYDWRDCAVLFRQNRDLLLYEQAARSVGIPTLLLVKPAFLKSTSVRAFISLMRLVINFCDDESFKLLLFSVYGMREKSDTSQHLKTALTEGKCLKEYAREKSLWPEIVESIDVVAQQSSTAGVFTVFEQTPVWRKLTAPGHPHAAAMAFTQWAMLQLEANPELNDPEAFLERCALGTATDEDLEQVNAVRLGTAHAAKGLEWPVVFLPNFREGRWPNNLALAEGRLEEERRLAYVAMTRARDQFHLSYHTENPYPNAKPHSPSRFIAEAGLKIDSWTAEVPEPEIEPEVPAPEGE